MRLNFRTKNEQSFEGFAGHVQVRFAGVCSVCGRNLYQVKPENEGWQAPDPRGAIPEQHCERNLDAADYGLQGPEFPLCYQCWNNEPTYKQALEQAKKTWGPEEVIKARQS